MTIKVWLVLVLTFSFSGVVGAQTDEHKLEQLRTYYEDARKFESSGNWAQAEKAWRTALSLDPNDARAWTNLGVALNRQNKDDEALSAWYKEISNDLKL